MMATQVWASGRRKPVPGGKTTTRRRRPRRRTSLMSILWSIITLVLSINFLIVQGVLLLIFAGLSLLITALSVMVDQRTDPAAVPTRRPTRRPAANPRGRRNPGGSSVPRCTKTGRPIDVCGCAQRHVATTDGAARYKRSVGDPMGGKAGGRKPAPASAGPVRKPARKSDWYDTVPGKKCSTCKGTGAGTDTTLRGGGSCRTCRGFGKVA